MQLEPSPSSLSSSLVLITEQTHGVAIDLVYAGSNGTQVSLVYWAFVGAGLARIREITVDLGKMSRAVQHPSLLDTPTVADPGRR